MVSPDKTRMDAYAWNYAYLTCSLAGMKGALYDHLWDINIVYDMRGQVGFALLSLLSLLGLINCHGFPSLIWRLRQSFRLTPRPVRSRFLLKSAMLDHLALSVGWLWRCHLGWHFAHLFQGQNMQVLQVVISICLHFFTAALASLCSYLHHSFEVLHAYPMVKARTILRSQRIFWSHTTMSFDFWIGIAYNLVDHVISTLPQPCGLAFLLSLFSFFWLLSCCPDVRSCHGEDWAADEEVWGATHLTPPFRRWKL